MKGRCLIFIICTLILIIPSSASYMDYTNDIEFKEETFVAEGANENHDIDPYKSVVGPQFALPDPEGETRGLQAYSPTTEQNVHGGSWVDTFLDGTGIDWQRSSGVVLDLGNVKLGYNPPQGLNADPNTVALWHLDEGAGQTAFDETTNNNDGTLGTTGGSDMADPSWVTGFSQSALDFDGSNDYVDCGNDNSLDLTGPYTIETRVKLHSYDHNKAFISRGATPTLWPYYSLTNVNSDGKVYFYSGSGGQFEYMVTNSVLTQYEWYYIAAVVRGTGPNQAELWVDDQLDTTGTLGYPGITTEPLFIGQWRSGYHFDGMVDEVRISDIARSPGEIRNAAGYVNYNGNITTNSITLPQNMIWNDLIINKTETPNHLIKVTILDATTGQAIPGFTNMPASGDVDLSNLNSAGVSSIKLNASFEGGGQSTPLLHSWGVSWNLTDAWRDTFFGQSKMKNDLQVFPKDGQVGYREGLLCDTDTVGLWHLDEGTGQQAFDESSNNNDGILGSSTGIDSTDPSWSGGYFGGALDFDGSDDFVDFGDIDQAEGPSGTFETWFKLDTLTHDYNSIICKSWAIATVARYLTVRYENNQGYLQFSIYDGDWHFVNSSSDSITAGNWYYAAVVWGPNGLKLYLDGIMVDSDAYTGFGYTSPYSVSIGEWKEQLGLPYGFDGIIDEVRISSISRSSYEIYNNSQLYQTPPSIISEQIAIPSNHYYDTAIIDKTEPVNNYVNISILDGQSEQPIPGYLIVTTNGEVDISLIDPVVHPSVRLKADFFTDGRAIPSLHDWSINWTINQPPSIIDAGGPTNQVYRVETLPLRIDLADKEDTEQEMDLEVQYKAPGDSQWQDTYLSDLHFSDDHWAINFTPPIDAELGDYDIQLTVSDFFGMEDQHSIIIKVMNNRPEFDEPPITISSSTVFRTELISIYSNAKDIEDTEGILDSTIQIRPALGTWSDLITTYNGVAWYSIFQPSASAITGLYDVRTNFTDKDLGRTGWVYDNESVMVKNNLPSITDVEIVPRDPYTIHELLATPNNGSDIEGDLLNEPLSYHYQWYLDDELQPDLTTPTVPSELTSKGDRWKCVVAPVDGENIGGSKEAEVTVLNMAPEIIEPLGTMTVPEDSSLHLSLIETFSDQDGDELIFISEYNENVDVTIYKDNKTALLVPHENWHGTETITFKASDGDEETSDVLTLKFTPVNDAPEIYAMNALLVGSDDMVFSVNEDDLLDVTIYASDAEGDDLIFSAEPINPPLTGSSGALLSCDPVTGVISFFPKNDHVGTNTIQIKVLDTHGSLDSVNITLNVLNTNDPPRVTILQPPDGRSITFGNVINLTCDVADDDLLHGNELLSFIWSTNLTEEILGVSRNITRIVLPVGHHQIKMVVTDGVGASNHDVVNITVKDIEPIEEKEDGANSGSSSILLWLFIIIIILLAIALTSLMIWRKKKKREEEISSESSDVPLVKAEMVYRAPVLTQTMQSQPTVGMGPAPTSPVLTQTTQVTPLPLTTTPEIKLLPPNTTIATTQPPSPGQTTITPTQVPLPEHQQRSVMLDQLERLAELKDQGILTGEEFNKQKEKLLE